jgi:hypothetical protein
VLSHEGTDPEAEEGAAGPEGSDDGVLIAPLNLLVDPVHHFAEELEMGTPILVDLLELGPGLHDSALGGVDILPGGVGVHSHVIPALQNELQNGLVVVGGLVAAELQVGIMLRGEEQWGEYLVHQNQALEEGFLIIWVLEGLTEQPQEVVDEALVLVDAQSIHQALGALYEVLQLKLLSRLLDLVVLDEVLIEGVEEDQTLPPDLWVGGCEDA